MVVAALWAAANAVYVYIALGGAQVFRLESACLIFAALVMLRVLWPRGGNLPGAAEPSPHLLAAGVAVLGLWLWALLPFATLPFLSDDYVFLDLYGDASNIGERPEFFRPAFAAVFVALRGVGGGSPVPFHAAAFALHVTAAGLVYLLTRRMLQDAAAGLFAFAAFLLNPVQLEATLWVSGLQDVLWTVFVLGALWLYTETRIRHIGRVTAVAVLVAAALLSKETAVCVLLLLPLAGLALNKPRRDVVIMWAIVATITATYLLVRSRFVGVDPAFWAAPTPYFLKQMVAMPYRFFLQPWNPAAAAVPLSAAALICAGFIGWTALAAVRHPDRKLLWGGVVMFSASLPVYSYFFVREDLMGGRYLYFPAVGWALLLAALLRSTARGRVVPLIVIVCASLAWTAALRTNLGPWRTSGQLVTAMAEAIRAGTGTNTVIAEFQQRTGGAIVLRDGVPYEHRGVGIFINGYPEFVERAAR